jgi:hypothetical protein
VVVLLLVLKATCCIIFTDTKSKQKPQRAHLQNQGSEYSVCIHHYCSTTSEALDHAEPSPASFINFDELVNLPANRLTVCQGAGDA